MIIRSCCAGFVDGLILPRQGCAAISPLVIKASVGTLFKTRIIYCDELKDVLPVLKNAGAKIYKLSGDANRSVFENTANESSVYVLGNETDGVSDKTEALCDGALTIPMNNKVESLNVAVAAALIAFSPCLRKGG
jgi:23S rRNA (guanosine2251-2'-O)-methyltransferase